jgi:CRP-like cAMP-binding protein
MTCIGTVTRRPGPLGTLYINTITAAEGMGRVDAQRYIFMATNKTSNAIAIRAPASHFKKGEESTMEPVRRTPPKAFLPIGPRPSLRIRGISDRCNQCDQMSTPRCLDCSERYHLFAAIPSTDLAEILSAAHTKHFNRMQTIFSAGDEIHELMLLTEGSVKIIQVDEFGNEVILRLVVPGEIISPIGGAQLRRHMSAAGARTLCKVLAWDVATFEALSRRFPRLQFNALQILAEHLIEIENRFCDISTRKVPQRLARELARLLAHVGHKVGDHIEINLSQSELAQLTATTLFTVSRQLSIWQKDGVVSIRRLGVLVRNTRLLEEISELE